MPDLLGGLSLIPAMIGLFAVSEVLRFAQFGDSLMVITKQVGKVMSGMGALARKYWRQTLRGSVLGTIVGALPGAGADIASWMSYAMSKKLSKEPEKFGTGHPEGLVESGAANNSALAGAWIPALVFGIPGDSITAIAIGVLYMKDMNPGPTIFVNNPQNVYAVFLLFLIANLIMIPLGILTIKVASKLLKVPRSVLMPIILLFCIVGLVRHQQRHVRSLHPARLRPAGLVPRGQRLSDRTADPGHAARDHAGGALHPLDDQGRGRPDHVRRAADRGRARDFHRAPVGWFRLPGAAPQFDRARRPSAPHRPGPETGPGGMAPKPENGLLVGDDGQARCWWHGGVPDYLRYHDEEWGHPVVDDRRLFEKICLEGFQSGLSWLTILRKRENFRRAFDGFDFEQGRAIRPGRSGASGQ